MHPSLRLIGSAGLLALVAACAAPRSPTPTDAATGAPPAAISASATAPAASPAGSFDGVYRGRAPGNSRCGGTQSFNNPVRVSNGIARVMTNTAGEIEGPVAPDGSLMVQHGRQSLQGKFSGNSFSGMLSFNSCGYTMNYTKS